MDYCLCGSFDTDVYLIGHFDQVTGDTINEIHKRYYCILCFHNWICEEQPAPPALGEYLIDD